MAPLPANDVEFWVPPIPPAVLTEANSAAAGGGSGNYQAYPANTGAWAPNNTIGWTSQTYLSFATAGITQTYDLEAPVEEKPKRTRTKAKE
jgi:hypothetical protein